VFQKGIPSFDTEKKIDPMQAMAAAITKTNVKNLNRQAAKSIAFYPMVASNALSGSTLKITSKHLERKLADLIRIILSNDDIIDLSTNMTKADVIDMFKGATIGTDIKSQFATRDRKANGNLSESFPMSLGDLVMYIHENDIRDIEAVNYTVRNEAGTLSSVMSQSIDTALNESILNEGKDGKQSLGMAIDKHDKSGASKSASKVSKVASSEAGKTKQSKGVESVKADKVNDLSPLILEVKVVYKTEAGLETTTIIMAIKVVTHLVPTTDMVREVGASMQQDRFMFRAVQWATGEIQFWRDLVLNVNGMKKAAAGNRFTHLFQTLKMNASRATTAAALGGESLLPTSAMVMTMDEVEEIEREFNVDLQSPSQADKFFNLFGLVGFIIIDESTDSMYIYDEVTAKFDTTSLPAEKNDNKNQNDLMKILAATMSAR
jgi:PKD repeat protein